MGLAAYSTLDEYCWEAPLRTSAPVSASLPVWARNSANASLASDTAYSFANASRVLLRAASSWMSGKSPYVSRLPTEATGTPSHCSTLGRPRPKFTPVSTFLPPGSISLIVRPSQPSLPIVSGTAVCQTSVERKCERLGLGYPTPCMMATVSWSHRPLMGSMLELNPSAPFIGSTWSSGILTFGRAS